MLVTTPGATLQSDIGAVNNALDGTSIGSTTEAREGTVDGDLVNSPTGNITTDIGTVENGLNGSTGGNVKAREGPDLGADGQWVRYQPGERRRRKRIEPGEHAWRSRPRGRRARWSDPQRPQRVQHGPGERKPGGVSDFDTARSFNSQLGDFIAILSGNDNYSTISLARGIYPSLSDVLDAITTNP